MVTPTETQKTSGDGKESQGEPSEKRFKKPSIEEVLLQCAKIGLPDQEGEKFMSYYEANGWRVGRNPMRSWAHAIQNWKLNYDSRPQRNGGHRHVQPHRNDSITGSEEWMRVWAAQPDATPGEPPHPTA